MWKLAKDAREATGLFDMKEEVNNPLQVSFVTFDVNDLFIPIMIGVKGLVTGGGLLGDTRKVNTECEVGDVIVSNFRVGVA